MDCYGSTKKDTTPNQQQNPGYLTDVMIGDWGNQGKIVSGEVG